ncbi:MAG: glycosyltransferase family 39 protein [Anaeromyxobacteraceae bacterium]
MNDRPDTTPKVDLADPAAEAWLAARRGRVTLALAGLAVAVRLVVAAQAAGSPLPRNHEVVRDSDSFFFDAWGKRVAGGDLLQRGPWHPMASWMDRVAERALEADPGLPERLELPAAGLSRSALSARLWDRWLGGATFYQEPAYPYLVGLTYALAGPQVWAVFALQLLLGVAGVLLAAALGRRLFSESAGLAAGLLAILAPFPLLYELTLLRDGPAAVVTLALALAMHEAVARGGARRWFGLGVAFGAAALLKTSFLAFPVLMGLWRLASARPAPAGRLRAAALVAGGVAAGLAPVVLRNLAVGVPPLALNGSAAAMLPIYHVVGAPPFGLALPDLIGPVIVAGDGRPLAGLLAAARTHPSLGSLVTLELSKLLYAFHGFEGSNNVDVNVFMRGAPALRLLPATFAVIAPLAAVGLAGRDAARRAWPLGVAVAGTLASIVLSSALSRYRAPLTTALLPLAGAGLVRLLAWARARRAVALGAAALGTAAYLTWATALPPGIVREAAVVNYARLGQVYAAREEYALAALHLEVSLALAPGDPQVEAHLARALLLSGEPGEALRHVEAAARTLDSARLLELHAVVLARVGRTAEALEKARAALAKEPGRPAAAQLVQELDGGRGQPPAPATGGTP